jgi:hypothetical protein
MIMFKRASDQRNEEQKRIRGTIMQLMMIAVAKEITVSDPYTVDGAVLTSILKQHATLGSDSGHDIRNALRYLHEKRYLEVDWLETGDFTKVRITTAGIDLCEHTLEDKGVDMGRR